MLKFRKTENKNGKLRNAHSFCNENCYMRKTDLICLLVLNYEPTKGYVNSSEIGEEFSEGNDFIEVHESKRVYFNSFGYPLDFSNA